MALDRRISEAIDIIWARLDYNRGQEALSLIESAANDGVADAYYFLARCYAGECYVNPKFNFPEDDDKAEAFLQKSIDMGSALGMFGARRFGGFEPTGGRFYHAPYNSDREVWDAVADMALNGERFCELLLANAYYYGDSIDFLNLQLSDITNPRDAYIVKSMVLTAAELYEDIYSKGLCMAICNYKDIITSGDYGITPDQNKYNILKTFCHQRGISIN